MKKRITPLVLIVISLVIYCIHELFTDASGWAIIFTIYIGIPTVLIMFIFDFGLNKYLKSQIKIV
ncbi:TM2 domain-containing membrane protein YozV [Flavobacterium sp. 7E]|nr:TM2 domain-containing membrane protein YozV [Flavobacterium sp. 7E]